jgi:hypothetical protein
LAFVKYCLFFMLSVFSSVLVAQTGKVMFRIAPTDALIKVNGKTYQSLSTYDFPPGKYEVQAWKPTHRLVTTSFEVKAGETTYVTFGLLHAAEFVMHKHITSLYKVTKFSTRYISTVAYGAVVFDQWRKVKSASNRADQLYAFSLYQKQVHDLAVEPIEIEGTSQVYEQLKGMYYNSRENFYRRRRKAVIITSVGAVGFIGFQWLAIKLKKPEYTEKVLLSFFPTSINSNAGLAFNLNISIR